jgi:uncharacterized membrane protein
MTIAYDNVSGLGFLTSLLFILLVGIFVSSWVGSTVFWVGEWFIKKMPFVRHIYSASKQVSTAVSPGSVIHTQLQFYVHQNVDRPYYFFKNDFSFPVEESYAFPLPA